MMSRREKSDSSRWLIFCSAPSSKMRKSFANNPRATGGMANISAAMGSRFNASLGIHAALLAACFQTQAVTRI